MELELKHIACYLPYYLEAISPELEIKTVDWKTQTYGTEKVGLNFLFSEYENTLYKPLLRPLEHLTKEIEHKGKKFVPIEVVSSMDITNYIVEHGNLYGGLYFPEKITPLEHQDVKNLPFWIVEKLIEWHFDIYDLIPKGLALPKP